MSKDAPRIAEAFEQQLDAIVHDRQFDGLEIVQHHARPVSGTLELSVTIDRPGGVDLALCERVAAYINASLGTQNEAYTLEIESAGLDRPLHREADYHRFTGQRARIVTTLTINGAKTHRGLLRGLRGEAVVVETDAGELLLPLAAIKSARLEFDPRQDFQRDKLQRKQLHGNSRKHGN
ncbi:MAG: ribosome maturation factor RimP [Candidatus Eremiobacteraeota bacterium]|nr:ribosome maturation factor RimP [Candidatus Eremiobacteraeota bacterium]MBV8499503.1 ribosome maturation factor RimP [Candidatus Eremiobacteraeota bacterium]